MVRGTRLALTSLVWIVGGLIVIGAAVLAIHVRGPVAAALFFVLYSPFVWQADRLMRARRKIREDTD